MNAVILIANPNAASFSQAMAELTTTSDPAGANATFTGLFTAMHGYARHSTDHGLAGITLLTSHGTQHSCSR